MLISVIVPVYNVERYLKRCVHSIMAQTYREIEILLVDDGSRDSSGRLCDELAAQDARIRVFHKENGGVSSARNVGIEMASGEYLCFVDSDDWLDTDYFSKAVPVLQKERPRLLMNNYVKDDGDGHVSCRFSSSTNLRFDGNGAFRAMANGSHLGWEPIASFYEAIGCKKVRFDTGIIYGEDLLFRFQFTQMNDGTYIYQYLPAYHYFQRPDSAVHSYAAYKKADDLKVFERCMAGTDEETRKVLLRKAYLPGLVRCCVTGSRSTDSRDLLVVRKAREKIVSNLGTFFCEKIGCWMRLKLVVCLLPMPVLKMIAMVYDKIKAASIAK